MNGKGDDLRAIEALDTVKLLADGQKSLSSELVAKALELLPAHYLETQQAPEMQGIGDAPVWRGYEMRLWELSEHVRRYLMANRRIRGRCNILNNIASITTDRRLGKGRQNFIIILGQYGGDAYTDELGALLLDPDVLGHAVKALTRLKAPNYVDRIKVILSESKAGWIKAAAKKYLTKVLS